MAEIYRALVADGTRLEQVVDDVLTASETGANILMLTTWVEHLNASPINFRPLERPSPFSAAA
jgi:hypothetical protein